MVLHRHGNAVEQALAPERLHQVEDPDGGRHRAQETRLRRARRVVEHRHADHETRAVPVLLQQVERGRGHRVAAVPAVLHGGQVGGLGADVQAQHAFIARHGPQVLGHEILGPFARRPDGEVGVAVGGQRGVGAHTGFIGGPLGTRHPAGERQVAHAGIPLAHLQVAGRALELRAGQVRIGREQAAQAVDDLGMPLDPLAQRVGERAGLLHEPGLPGQGHRVGLLPGQPQADRHPQHGHAQPGQPVPIATVWRQGRHGRKRVGMQNQNSVRTVVVGGSAVGRWPRQGPPAKRRIAAIRSALEQPAAEQLVTSELFGGKCRQRNTLMRQQL
jgi:hypothetical protein